MLGNFKKILNTNREIYLCVKVRPNAVATNVRDVLADETLKIDIAAPAERGKANVELIRFLATEFGVNRVNVRIISGAGERTKLIKIQK